MKRILLRLAIWIVNVLEYNLNQFVELIIELIFLLVIWDAPGKLTRFVLIFSRVCIRFKKS